MLDLSRLSKLALAGLTALLMPSGAFAAELLYGNSVDAGLLRSYNPSTSAGTTYTIGGGQQIAGLAADDASKRLYVSFGGGGTIAGPTNNLYTYDYNGNLLASVRTGNASLGGTGGGVTIQGLTFANNTLYGTHQNGSTAGAGIYTIDPTNGTLTLAASLSSGSVQYNIQDIDYDDVNGRFIGINTAVTGTPGSAAGLYSIVLPATPGGFATVTQLAGLPTDAPAGNATPDGLAYDDASGIVYLTYNRTGTISRYDLTHGSYLAAVTGPALTPGSSGFADATFATGFVGVVPEPITLAFAPLLAAGLRRRRPSQL